MPGLNYDTKALIGAINKRDTRITAVRLWFAEWELTLPQDAREAFKAAMPWAVAYQPDDGKENKT